MSTPSADTVNIYHQVLLNIATLQRKRLETERGFLRTHLARVHELRENMLDVCQARWELYPNSAYSAHLKPMAKIVYSYDERMEHCEQLWRENTPNALKELRKQLRYVEDMMARTATSCLLGWERATRETKEKVV